MILCAPLTCTLVIPVLLHLCARDSVCTALQCSAGAAYHSTPKFGRTQRSTATSPTRSLSRACRGPHCERRQCRHLPVLSALALQSFFRPLLSPCSRTLLSRTALAHCSRALLSRTACGLLGDLPALSASSSTLGATPSMSRRRDPNLCFGQIEVWSPQGFKTLESQLAWRKCTTTAGDDTLPKSPSTSRPQDSTNGSPESVHSRSEET